MAEAKAEKNIVKDVDDKTAQKWAALLYGVMYVFPYSFDEITAQESNLEATTYLS